MKTETMSILPRFSHTSGAELEAHRVPQHVITFVEQGQEHLQRLAQDQNGFRAGLTSTRTHHLITALRSIMLAFKHWLDCNSLFLVTSSLNSCNGRALLKEPGKPNMLQSAQLFNNRPHVPPSTSTSDECIQHAVNGCLRFLVLNSSARSAKKPEGGASYLYR